MKQVSFVIEEDPVVEYDRDRFKKDLRDNVVKYLIKKLNLNLLSLEDLTQIFEKSLKLTFSAKQLTKLESLSNKFEWLPYDRIVQNLAYILVGLCNAYRPLVLQHIYPISGSSYAFFDPNREDIRPLCKQVATFAKQCVEDFLEELRETGTILTSEQLAQKGKESYSDEEFEEDTDSSSDYPDDFDPYDEPSTARATDTSSASNHAILFEEEKKEENQSQNATENEAKSIFTTIIQNILSWIYDLPEWMQKQFLNSVPIKSLIESIEYAAKIYNSKSSNDLFKKNVSTETYTYSSFQEEEKAKILPSADNLVDTNLMLKEHPVNYWILPTSANFEFNILGEANQLFNQPLI